MPNHLSILGIIHTAISILALLVAFFCLLRDGKINPANGTGRLYVLLTVITCFTALPIMRNPGHFTPGHYVAVIILILLPIGIYARSIHAFGKAADYIQVIIMSTTLFLSCIPAIVETLTRVPISHPIASGPNDPLIQNCLLGLFIMFVAGVAYQTFKLKKKKKSMQAPTMKFS